jgi:beta-N-acetylhexosaminidase
VVLGLRRDRLGFAGVIVSDALDMAGASSGRGIPEAAVLALIAGCDLLCIGPDKPASLVEDVRDAIISAVEDGRLTRERLAAAAARVRAMRVPATAQPGAPDAARLVEAATTALVVAGDLPDLTGAVVVSVETTANIAVGAVAWGLSPDHRIDPAALALPPTIADDVPLVVQVRDAHRRPDVVDFLALLAMSGRPAVVVEWGWPGAYDVGLATISTRGSSGPGVTAVEQLLREAGWAR